MKIISSKDQFRKWPVGGMKKLKRNSFFKKSVNCLHKTLLGTCAKNSYFNCPLLIQLSNLLLPIFYYFWPIVRRPLWPGGGLNHQQLFIIIIILRCDFSLEWMELCQNSKKPKCQVCCSVYKYVPFLKVMYCYQM